MFELIIFDCDGVLVDTEEIQLGVMAEMVQALGGTLTKQEALKHFRGGKMADHLQLIEANYLSRPLPADFEPTMRQRWEETFYQKLTPIAGVQTVLETIQLPKCVASNGPLAKMQLTLTITELIGFFNGRLYSAYDIGHWKPDPRLYLHAAVAMGIPPERCAVVEDSAVGVRAAVAAGMTVFGFAENGDGEALAALGAIPFQAMEQLPELLAHTCET